MELLWIFAAVVVADVATTLVGIRLGLEDVWFGRRALPMLFQFSIRDARRNDAAEHVYG